MRFDLNTNRNHKKIVPQNSPFITTAKRIGGGDKFFVKKRLKHICILSSFILIYLLSAEISDFKGLLPLAAKIPESFIWLLKNFIPSKESLNNLPLILRSCFFTVSAAVAATSCAGLLAFALAVFSSETTRPNKTLAAVLTFAASVIRNIPLAAWAILLLLSFKQSEFTGFLALFTVTFAHLIRAFKEMIDETSSESFNALRAAGVPYLSAFFQTVLPSTAPGILSWILYALENNIRDSALVGILTGTGAGFLFSLYFRSFRYNSAGLIILILTAIVLMMDILSNKIRRSLL